MFEDSSKNDNLKQGETKLSEVSHERSSREVTDKIIIKATRTSTKIDQPRGLDDHIKWRSRLQWETLTV